MNSDHDARCRCDNRRANCTSASKTSTGTGTGSADACVLNKATSNSTGVGDAKYSNAFTSIVRRSIDASIRYEARSTARCVNDGNSIELNIMSDCGHVRAKRFDGLRSPIVNACGEPNLGMIECMKPTSSRQRAFNMADSWSRSVEAGSARTVSSAPANHA